MDPGKPTVSAPKTGRGIPGPPPRQTILNPHSWKTNTKYKPFAQKFIFSPLLPVEKTPYPPLFKWVSLILLFSTI
jgi:hypothetical protein